MTRNSELEDVERVLLGDGWHVVADRTFELRDFDVGRAERGFAFKNPSGNWLSGPSSSILAIDSGANG